VFFIQIESKAQDSFSASGNVTTGTGGSSSFTIGQIANNYISGTDGSITQGVQQPYNMSNTVNIFETEDSLGFITYPNPTNDIIILYIDSYDSKKMTYQLYNLQGKLVAVNRINNNISTISIQELPESIYLLKILDNELLIKTFKIIKTK
jgi:hypothetical protein